MRHFSKNMEEVASTPDEINPEGLCPCCDREVEVLGSVFKMTTPENMEEIYYLLCKKCSKKVTRADQVKRKKIYSVISERLENTFSLYAAKVVEKDHFKDIVSRRNEKKHIAELGVDNSWNEEDRLFFEKNPDRKFYARLVHKGELEETYKDNPSRREETIEKGIRFAIVHEVAKGQRVRAYVGGLEGKPYNEDAYVAALFLVKLGEKFSVDDIDALYEEIKTRKKTAKELGLNFF